MRGYLTGSGRKDYEKTGMVCGIELPEGLVEASRLPEPIYTPSTKAAIGDHDENVSFDKTVDLIGREMAEKVRDMALELYRFGAEYALERGIIIADTKFEFGLLDGELILIDEIMTPDSSRFWPADGYEAGKSQPSYDKQYVRDYLETLDWDKTAPGPGAAAGGGGEDLREVPGGVAPPDEVVSSGGAGRAREAGPQALRPARAGRAAGLAALGPALRRRRAHLGRRAERARAAHRRPPAAVRHAGAHGPRRRLRLRPRHALPGRRSSAAGPSASTARRRRSRRRARSTRRPCAARARRGLDVEYLAADLASFAADPERAGAFDVVFTCNVYHLLGPIGRREFAAALAAVTRPGGLLFLSTMSPRDPQHYAVGEPVSRRGAQLGRQGVPALLHGRGARRATSPPFEILDLDERGYDEPRASGRRTTTRAGSWRDAGAEPAARRRTRRPSGSDDLVHRPAERHDVELAAAHPGRTTRSA